MFLRPMAEGSFRVDVVPLDSDTQQMKTLSEEEAHRMLEYVERAFPNQRWEIVRCVRAVFKPVGVTNG